MDSDLLNLLKNNKIFASLTDEELIQILPKFSKIELSHNEILFYQGEPSDSVYLLISGKLSAILIGSNHLEKVVGHIHPNETVGESGALTNEPRSLTIKAMTRSVLYKLASTEFVALCQSHSAMMLAAIHPVITRSQDLIRILTSEKSNRHIAIVPAHQEINLDEFYAKLTVYLQKFPNILVISDQDAPFHQKDSGSTYIRDQLYDIEHDHKATKIIYFLHSNDSEFAKICLKKANIIYVAAHYNSTHRIDQSLLEKIHSPKSHLSTDPALILLYPNNASLPRNTAAWMSITTFSLNLHVRLTSSKDFNRLTRFMRERAVGLILGGGGTRGWAHLGVIKALRELKIPIDFIGGTSVGAMIGAAYAMHESYEDAYERFHKMVFDAEDSVTWRAFTFPAISIFNGKTFSRAQREVFGNTYIEDLRIPFFCISCNLATNSEVVHRTGLLWEKVRASSAVPGIVPPMVIDNELHLDGGMLNNLPVDVARMMLGNKAKIYSVEISTFSSDKHKYNFPPSLPFWETLFIKLRLRHREYHFPRFVETFLRALFIGSFAKAKQNSLAANVAINLNLNKFRLLHSTEKQADRLIEIGYESALQEIQRIKSKDSPELSR